MAGGAGPGRAAGHMASPVMNTSGTEDARQLAGTRAMKDAPNGDPAVAAVRPPALNDTANYRNS